MTVVLAFDGGIDAGHEGYAINATISTVNNERYGSLGLDGVGEAFEVEGFRAGDLVARGVLAVGEFQGQHAHAD